MKKVSVEQSIFAKIFECTQEGIMLTDSERNILQVNPAFTAVTGYQQEEVIGKNPRMLQSGRHDANFYRMFWQQLSITGQWQGEIWNRRKNGEIYPEWLNISTIRDTEGKITNYVAIFSDITVIKTNESNLVYLAHHDALTGLPNRLLFLDRLGNAIAHASRNSRMLALLFIDLDRFKPVNDTLGHRTGDLLLQTVAERLRGCVREADTVARLGGDEFVILLTEIGSSRDADKVAEKVIDNFLHPFLLEGHRIEIGCSVGISLYPRDGENIDLLIKNADRAMYQAKALGGNKYKFHTR